MSNVQAVCTVSGVKPDGEPIPPCGDPATGTVWFRCANGHEKSRQVCGAHAVVLAGAGMFGKPICRECFEATGVEVPVEPAEGSEK